jgi:hypothetical protein
MPSSHGLYLMNSRSALRDLTHQPASTVVTDRSGAAQWSTAGHVGVHNLQQAIQQRDEQQACCTLQRPATTEHNGAEVYGVTPPAALPGLQPQVEAAAAGAEEPQLLLLLLLQHLQLALCHAPLPAWSWWRVLCQWFGIEEWS